MNKALRISLIGLAVVAVSLVGTSGRASALSMTTFTLTSDPSTAVVDLSHITTPPLPGEPLTVKENVKDATGQVVGSGEIDCQVLAFTTTDLLLDCSAHYALTNGTISGHALFWTFQHDYPAVVTGGTGAYQGATGTVEVQDRAPGDETYTFNLLQL